MEDNQSIIKTAFKNEIEKLKLEIQERKARIEQLKKMLEDFNGPVINVANGQRPTRALRGNQSWSRLFPWLDTQTNPVTAEQIIEGMFKGKHSKTKAALRRRLHQVLYKAKKDGFIISFGEKGQRECNMTYSLTASGKQQAEKANAEIL